MKSSNKTRIAVIFGGRSGEHEVSLRSAESVLKALDPAKLAKESEDLFERTVKEFGDLKSHRGPFADAAKGELFEVRNLAVGKVAPDIEGEDIDGVKFKLSDYRGKVVVLDFWGDW